MNVYEELRATAMAAEAHATAVVELNATCALFNAAKAVASARTSDRRQTF